MTKKVLKCSSVFVFLDPLRTVRTYTQYAKTLRIYTLLPTKPPKNRKYIHLSPHFLLEEFTKSYTAQRLNIDNKPGYEQYS